MKYLVIIEIEAEHSGEADDAAEGMADSEGIIAAVIPTDAVERDNDGQPVIYLDLPTDAFPPN